MKIIFSTSASLLLSVAAATQCGTGWQLEAPGNQATVVYTSLVWTQPGGAPVLVVGGAFSPASRMAGNNIAILDLASGRWRPLGLGTDGAVKALAQMPNGDLIASGSFQHAGGVAASHIARWNGAAWAPLGAGMDGDVNALKVLPNGDLAAGGAFHHAGGLTADLVAVWKGATWQALGSLGNGSVNAMEVLPGGDIVVDGSYGYIFQWSSGAWAVLRQPNVSWILSGIADGCRALTIDSAGQLVAAGRFYTGLGAYGYPSTYGPFSTLQGNGWITGTYQFGSEEESSAICSLPTGYHAMGIKTVLRPWYLPYPVTAYLVGNLPGNVGHDATNGWVHTITLLPSGSYFVGGAFTVIDGAAANGMAIWNGSAWSIPPSYTSPLATVRAMGSRPDGSVVICSSVTTAASLVLRTAQGAMFPLVSAAFPVDAIEADVPGDAFVGGPNGVATVDTSIPSAGIRPLPSTVNGAVHALRRLPLGGIVAGGSFTQAGGQPAARIAIWSGSNWSPMGSGFTQPVRSLAIDGSGAVVAGGSFAVSTGDPADGIARWNGTVWQPLGLGVAGTVLAIARLPSGDLVAGGTFASAGGAPANNIARWDGAAWQPLGSGTDGAVAALLVTANGDLIAGGSFAHAGGAVAQGVARWDGSNWASMQLPVGASSVLALAESPAGTILVGGTLSAAQGTAYLATGTTTCLAQSIAYGRGCAGNTGPCVLGALSAPWAGNTFRARAVGMPSLGVAAGVYGLTPLQLPLSSFSPQGAAGCDLLASSDIVTFVPVAGGVADSELFVPRDTWLIGQTGYHQIVGIEIDALSNLIALTSTNGLALTIGAY